VGHASVWSGLPQPTYGISQRRPHRDKTRGGRLFIWVSGGPLDSCNSIILLGVNPNFSFQRVKCMPIAAGVIILALENPIRIKAYGQSELQLSYA
jgi:hypothetical protein